MSAGQIHDLGYKRYVGSRRAFGTRWRVIMRHQLSSAWKGWWRFKLWLILGLVMTAILAGVMYFLSGQMFGPVRGFGGQMLKLADALIPFSARLYCKVGFMVSLTVGSMVVSGDVQSGAFTFYFARSLRPRDYVIGKLAGLCVLLAVVMVLGPLALAGMRLGLSENLDDLVRLLPVLYKALAMGVVGTLAYAVVPLGFSALVTNKRHALALWAAYYVVIGFMVDGLGILTKPWVGAFDLAAAYQGVSHAMFDTQLPGRDLNVPLGPALISIGVHVVAAIGVVLWRVRNAQETGVGGSS